MSTHDSPKFELKDVVESLASMTDVMKKMALQIGDLEQRFDQGSSYPKGIHELKTPTHGNAAAVHNLFEEIVEEHVNAAMAGDKNCKKSGIGKDGLLLCRWLGEKGTCCFDHPSSELALKGKGVSKDSQNPSWLNNGKKAFQMSELSQDPFYDSFQLGESSQGGGAADGSFEE